MSTSAPGGPLPLLVTAKDIAAELDLPLPRIYELARARQIPAVRLGRALRFDRDRVRAWLARGGTEAQE
ncbi:MAG: helix-turn-helix domain-containing protein [Gemmatimonadetes bacterium]|nr:helix-turn-helix domain-containing protein [Gemmatimonadota bacterium]